MSAFVGFSALQGLTSGLGAASKNEAAKKAHQQREFRRRWDVQANNLQITAEDARINVANQRDIREAFDTTIKNILQVESSQQQQMINIADQTSLMIGSIKSSTSARNLDVNSGTAKALMRATTLRALAGAAVINENATNATRAATEKYKGFRLSKPLLRRGQGLFIAEPFSGPSSGSLIAGAVLGATLGAVAQESK